jgi:probable rRNA maturation factor
MPVARQRLAEARRESPRPAGVKPEISVLNRQRRQPVSVVRLRAVLTDAAIALGARHRAMTLVLAGDRLVRDLNARYRAKDQTTDVLAFRADHGGADLGDVVISVETAARQAGALGHTAQKELEILALHGLLHLMGYDHETDSGEMRRLERSLRQKASKRRLAPRRGNARQRR